MNVGAIVARLQTTCLTDGHRELINFVKSKHNQVIILLGVSPVVGSKRNPLDYITRERMLREEYPDIAIAPLSDMPTDDIWSAQLDSITRLVCPVGAVTLYGGRDSFIPHYKGKSRTVEIDEKQSDSGTNIRQTAADKILVSADFRAGMIYSAYNRYDNPFFTVDIAVVKNGSVLLGKKNNSSAMYCFPGGFVDRKDKTLEEAATRECKEETNLDLHKVEYLASLQGEDWRYRNKDDGSVMTAFFLAQFPNYGGEEKASDDLDGIEWVGIDGFKRETLVKTHWPLLAILQKRLNY